MASYEELLNKINGVDGDVVTEAPIDKWMSTIKDIKDSKPDEYSNDKEIKDFVDDNYSDISKIAKLLEEEPEKLKKESIIWAIGFILTHIAFMGLMFVHPIGSAGILVNMVVYLIATCIQSVRANKDLKAYKELCKIRESLKKIKDKKIPESYKKKISKLINDIDDMQTEFTNGPIKVTESTSDEVIEVLTSFNEGVITEEEKDFLLSNLE